jgi:hypothetical protein
VSDSTSPESRSGESIGTPAQATELHPSSLGTPIQTLLPPPVSRREATKFPTLKLILVAALVLLLGFFAVDIIRLIADRVPKPTPITQTPPIARLEPSATATISSSSGPAYTSSATLTPTPSVTPTTTRSPTPITVTQSPTPMTPSPTPTFDKTPAVAAIMQVLESYVPIKVQAMSRIDGSRLPEVVIDPALESQRRAICWLRNHGYRYVYYSRYPTIKSITFNDKAEVTVLMRITEDAQIVDDRGTPIDPKAGGEYAAIFQLRQIGGRWYIFCLNTSEKGELDKCELKFDDPSPCG